MKQQQTLPQISLKSVMHRQQFSQNINTPQFITKKVDNNSQKMAQSHHILRKNASMNIISQNDQQILKKVQPIRNVKQQDKQQQSIFSLQSDTLINEIMNMKYKDAQQEWLVKQGQGRGKQSNSMQTSSLNILNQAISLQSYNAIPNEDETKQKLQALNHLKSIFYDIQKSIMDLFSKRLEESTVIRDSKSIPLLKRVDNYGATKQNTLFHLNKYLDLCLNNCKLNNKSTMDQFCANSSSNKRYNNIIKQEEEQELKVLCEIPREVSVLFIECIEQCIMKSEQISKKEFIISIFKERIHLIQPATQITEICSTDQLQKIVEIIYDELEDEPYLTTLIPKKTRETLLLANQLVNNLLIKNFQVIPHILASFKNVSFVFRDPSEKIQNKLLILQQDNKEDQSGSSSTSIPIPIVLNIQEQSSKDHFFENLTHVDFYLIKCAIRKALERKERFTDDEINVFLQTVEETRYIAMPHLYKWVSHANTISLIIKSITSKIFSMGSDVLNQYFPSGNLCPIIYKFSLLLTTHSISQPNLFQLKKILTLNQYGKVTIPHENNKNSNNNNQQKYSSSLISKKRSASPQNIQNIQNRKDVCQQNRANGNSLLKVQMQFLNRIADIMKQSLKKINSTFITQRDIHIRFQKVGIQFIPSTYTSNEIRQITSSEFVPAGITLANIECIMKHFQNYLATIYKQTIQIQNSPFNSMIREFLLSFFSSKNTYSTDDLLSSLKYYEITKQQLSFLYKGLTYCLGKENLWTNTTKQLIEDEFSTV